MAIQFPPINVGDPEPLNGDTFLYLPTQEEWKCNRDSMEQKPQWAAKGVINDTSFGYRGLAFILGPAPTDAEVGNIYSVADGGIANESWIGLAGQQVNQWSLIIYAEPEWVRVSAPVGPWVRTIGGQIQPVNNGDDLNMLDGNYGIETLPDLF